MPVTVTGISQPPLNHRLKVLRAPRRLSVYHSALAPTSCLHPTGAADLKESTLLVCYIASISLAMPLLPGTADPTAGKHDGSEPSSLRDPVSYNGCFLHADGRPPILHAPHGSPFIPPSIPPGSGPTHCTTKRWRQRCGI